MTDEEQPATADDEAPEAYAVPSGPARLLSSAIDGMVAGLFVTLFSSSLINLVLHPPRGGRLTVDQQRTALWLELVALGLAVLLFVLLERVAGATIGKRTMRIRLVGPDGRKPSWGRLVLKYVSLFFLLLLGYLGLLLVLAGLATCLVQPQRRNVFDLLAGTRPVALPRPGD